MRNILIVDDDKNNRLAIKLNIQKHPDLKIYEAENGQEAVKMASDVVMHLVFMDIMMPVMNGIDATREIKKRSPQTMIVAVSAMDDDEHKSLMLQAGCEDYITKPFNPEILKKRLSNYLHLIVNRSTLHTHANPRNCFGESVYDRSVVFRISHESSLALMWEEYLFSDKYSGFILLSDAIRTLYDVSLELLKKESSISFCIVSEENDDALFFTLKYPKSLEANANVPLLLAKEFANGEFKLQDECLSIKIPCVAQCVTPNIPLADEKSVVPIESHAIVRVEKQKISAIEYISEHVEDFEDRCEDFEHLYEQLDSLIFDISRSGDYHLLNKFGEHLVRFSEQVNTLFEFHHIAESIFKLGDRLIALDVNSADADLKHFVLGFIGSFLSDLDNWIHTIFVDKTASDIHYLDNSLSSSLESILPMIGGESNSSGDVDIELF